MQNKGTKGAWPTSRDLLFEFWYAFNISRTAVGTNFRFEIQLAHNEY